MENLLLNFDYPILSHLNIPYQFQIEDEFSYSIAQYNELHEDDDPRPPEYQAMRTVLYKLKYPDYANMNYETVQGNTYLTLFLTPSDRSDGYIGFHDGSQILLQSKTIDYPVNVDDIAVPQPSLNPNTVVFDPIAITPDFTQSLSKRSRDTLFNPPMYSVDIKTEMNIAREITVTPSSFPYYFSIDDYNQSNNTEFIGVRRLAVNGSTGGSVVVKDVKFYIDSSRYNANITNLQSYQTASYTVNKGCTLVFMAYRLYNSRNIFTVFCVNNNSTTTDYVFNIYATVNCRLYYSHNFTRGTGTYVGFGLFDVDSNKITTIYNFQSLRLTTNPTTLTISTGTHAFGLDLNGLFPASLNIDNNSVISCDL